MHGADLSPKIDLCSFYLFLLGSGFCSAQLLCCINNNTSHNPLPISDTNLITTVQWASWQQTFSSQLQLLTSLKINVSTVLTDCICRFLSSRVLSVWSETSRELKCSFLTLCTSHTEFSQETSSLVLVKRMLKLLQLMLNWMTHSNCKSIVISVLWVSFYFPVLHLNYIIFCWCCVHINVCTSKDVF